jgi:glycosyltransferase involved in cell wall biosynthesis
MMKALVKKGVNVTGAGAGGDGFEAKIADIGVAFKRLPIDKKGINPLADIKLAIDLYRWYKIEKPDIVHHFTIKPVIYGSIAARLAGVSQVINTITGAGYVFTEQNVVWLRRIVEVLYRIALGCAHFTFFQNQDDKSYFTRNKLIKKSKVGLLPGSGVDCTHFSPVNSPASDPKQSSTVLMVSRLLRDKGVYEFVEAARRVKKILPDTTFQLLGRRDIRNPNVVPESDLDIWGNQGVVAWLGEVMDVRPAIAGADMVVLPSYREGLSRGLMEAAAMGKPIITTDAVGCREVVDDGVTGVIVPIKDISALSEAMLKMLRNPEMRQSMGKAGRSKMQSEFDEKIVIDEIFRIYFNQSPSPASPIRRSRHL